MSKSPELSEKQKGKLFLASGSTHPKLALETAEYMGLEVGSTENRQHPDTELYARYEDSVRGKHVIVMQTHSAAGERSINDSLQEQLIMLDAARRASAKRVTAVSPYLAYQRQDRKAKGRESITAALAIRQLAMAGAQRIVSVDLHSAQTQGAFDDPFDHMTAQPLLRKFIKKNVVNGNEDDFVLVSPDSGRAKQTEQHGLQLGLDFVHLGKTRDPKDSSKIIRQKKIDGVGGRDCILFDDMIDTAGTLVSAAEVLKNSGANRVIAAATHGLFSDPAIERLQDSTIDNLIVTDSVPQDVAQAELGDRLQVVSIAPLLGRTLIEVVTNGSVSQVFRGQNHM